MRTTRTWTERPYEALLFPGIGFRVFPAQLRWKAKKASFGARPIYHFGRARLLTLCQDLRAKGQSQFGGQCAAHHLCRLPAAPLRLDKSLSLLVRSSCVPQLRILLAKVAPLVAAKFSPGLLKERGDLPRSMSPALGKCLSYPIFYELLLQGGIEGEEDARISAFRELKEETGVTSAEILAEVPYWLTYDFPPEAKEKLNKLWGIDWKGQAQK
ncbi:hypothetical protein ZIOFF_029931 [Zingiber officinale]|uniref:Nudix hydrolase domain-containing protein n=1 Tax=Zingiber officinale TaxID=94328 RepID=A0A8J5GUL1_ZINOF|nr:hypothetical protein ZIOFF_029931 [Zingiber officinale]